MTERPEDEFDLLRSRLKAATPAPDPAVRAEALRRAMAEFDKKNSEEPQGLAHPMRPMTNRPRWASLVAGVRDMFDRLTPKAVLGAGASLATLSIAMVLVINPQMPSPDEVSPLVAPKEQTLAPASAALDHAAPEIAAPLPSVVPQVEMTGDAPMMEMAGKQSLGQPSAGQAPMARMSRERMPMPPMAEPSADSFAEFDRQGLQITAEQPVSTFSIDVDTASWSWLRGSLRHGNLPDPASVRIEEMVNYFPYAYPAPKGDAPFSTAIDILDTPWNANTRLVRIGLQGKLPETEARPPLNLVFLVDTSGSMQGEDRIGLLKSSFSMLLGTLRPEDQVAIVAYAGSAGEVLAPTKASDKAAILAALDRLEAGGSTAGGEGLTLAYATAERMAGEGASVSRVILATDGDFNVGPQSPEELTRLVEAKRETGVYLSVLGFGRGNLDDALMQALAQNGNGQAAYIDSAEEARKVLVDQVAGALFPIANDVKIQVEWNPATVAEYRLIGYETRALAREDFSNDKVDAGEIGAGHQVTALYEITPADSAGRMTEPLRYGNQTVTGIASDEAGWLRLRYKAPGEPTSQMIEAPIAMDRSEGDADAKFASAIAGFGQLLTGGKYLGTWGYEKAIALAEAGKGEDPFGYRAEAIRLMRVAASLGK